MIDIADTASPAEEVIINGKRHKRLSQRSRDELEHMRQLAEIEVVNYRNASRNYPADRTRRFGLPHLARLVGVVETIAAHLVRRGSNGW